MIWLILTISTADANRRLLHALVMAHRFETEFGDDGMSPGSNPVQGRLRAFAALYRFQGRMFGLVVWARDWHDARRYAREHGMKIDGQIEATYEA